MILNLVITKIEENKYFLVPTSLAPPKIKYENGLPLKNQKLKLFPFYRQSFQQPLALFSLPLPASLSNRTFQFESTLMPIVPKNLLNFFIDFA